MTKLALASILIVLCIGIAHSSPCFQQHHPVCAPPPHSCAHPPPPPPPEHHCREKDHSKEKKHHKKCKDKKKKKKDKKKHDDEDRSVSIDIDIDINIVGQVFTQSQYVDNKDRDIYMAWMNRQCTHEQLEYIDIVVDYLEVQESLAAEIIDFEIFQKNINSVYEVLQSHKIYSAEVDLHSQRAVFEKVKTQFTKAMSGLSEQSALYVALNYCAHTEISIMPIIVGLCRSVATSQQTYLSHSSTRSISSSVQGHCKDNSEEEKHHKKECKDHSKEKKHERKECKDHSKEEKHHKDKKKECKDHSEEEKHHKKEKKHCEDHSKEEKHHKKECTDKGKKKKDSSSSREDVSINIDIDINFYGVFTESQYVDNDDRDLYLTWMNQCTKDELDYISVIVKCLESQQALSTEITNYEVFQQSISSVYDVFRSSEVYSKQVDLYSKTSVFEETKTQIVQAMSGLSKESKLYAALDYCTQNETTVTPMVVGLCRSVAMSQKTYFSQTTTRSSSTSTTGRSHAGHY